MSNLSDELQAFISKSKKNSTNLPQKAQDAREYILDSLKDALEILKILEKFENGYRTPSQFLQDFTIHYERKINEKLKKKI